jgi:hypothetical protein
VGKPRSAYLRCRIRSFLMRLTMSREVYRTGVTHAICTSSASAWGGQKVITMTLTARWQRLLYLLLPGERCKKRAGFLQVGGVKALGAPVVDGCEEFIGFSPLALLSGGSPATRQSLAACRYGLILTLSHRSCFVS